MPLSAAAFIDAVSGMYPRDAAASWPVVVTYVSTLLSVAALAASSSLGSSRRR